VRTRSTLVFEPRNGAGLLIGSATGDHRPATVMIRPLLLGDEVVAVIELAWLGRLADDTAALLEDLAPFVVVSLDRMPPAL
jgi:hypothetical protein